MATKILLPDDAVIKDIMMNSFFHRDGFEFITAAPADQLFLQIEEQDPALVVLDVETAGIDATGLCEMIKNDAILEKTQIILVVPTESRKRDDEYSCIDADAIVGIFHVPPVVGFPDLPFA